MGQVVEISIPQELTIYNVNAFKDEVVSNLGSKQELILDCQEVEMIDGAGVQLLLSLEKTALNEEFNVEFKNLTPSFRETVELAGINELLDFAKEEKKDG
ncbi:MULTISPECIES: STAS domain-containing protein [unclassified Candidatus Frackibacter]|uniref:STAS domain-containing protein n=1 Tax=unclassified Candidatus Frackibacter TaxID=2648818 RepID=UPI00088B90B3|nr:MULTISPECIES: STAS domain-containing protein [unclassified Candidatus Frackibacter]SDC87202.1 anti-anti-sigma factor [Candidatus Frackibacter sp. WG11]SEN01481.1 anti-anti-sigma factor [Candidatus Frackibacter sp. WG12]SFM08964.1 anti-anti-sigma factor [Candidatus Frackibacter sp. WG13]